VIGVLLVYLWGDDCCGCKIVKEGEWLMIGEIDDLINLFI
jgi:hypothetical protein